MMLIRAEPAVAEFSVPSLLAFIWPRNHAENTEYSMIMSVCSV